MRKTIGKPIVFERLGSQPLINVAAGRKARLRINEKPMEIIDFLWAQVPATAKVLKILGFLQGGAKNRWKTLGFSRAGEQAPY